MPERDESTLPELHVVNALLIDPSGLNLLQRRDDKPGIESRNKLGLWGGAVEPGDASIDDAMLREIREETGLELSLDEIRKFAEYRRVTDRFAKRFGGQVLKINYLYVAYGIQQGSIVVHEGQGCEPLSNQQVAASEDCTRTTKLAVYDHSLGWE